MKITIACDGSEQSQNAVRLAGSLPFSKSKLHLVHIAPTIEFDSKFVSEEAQSQIRDFNADLERRGNEALDDAEKVLQDMDRACSKELVPGNPSEALVELSKQSDLLVVGSRGLNPVSSFFLGSVSDAVLRHGECPVLLYRAGEDYQVPTRCSNWVVGYDDTSASREACSFVKRVDAREGDCVDLVSVIQLSFYYGMSYSLAALENWPKQKETLQESMNAMAREITDKAPNLTAHTAIVTDGQDIAYELNQHALKKKADLIVVGAQGKTLVDRVFVGSTSNRLAHHADVPVLIVR